MRLSWVSNENRGLTEGDKTFAEYEIGGNAQIQLAPPIKRKHGEPKALSRNKCRKLRKARYLLRQNEGHSEEEEGDQGEEFVEAEEPKDKKPKT